MKFLYFLPFLICLYVLPASAQEGSAKNIKAESNYDFKTDDVVTPLVAKNAISQPQLENIQEREMTVLEDDHVGSYKLPTVENLSKLYWKKGALTLSNDKIIDNFLLINECSIYERFYKDDFEWQRIRKAARLMLEDQKDNFPEKFRIVIPIDLGRYDMDRKGFPLINNTSFLDLRRIEIGGNFVNEDICGNSKNIEGYPRNMILVLSKPFNYDFLELDEHIAQAYIIRQKYEPTKRPDDIKDERFNRLAFARIRMVMDKYQGETGGSSNQPLAIMFGRLEGIDIFEDYEEKRLLKSINLE